jgi:hypothetical protein
MQALSPRGPAAVSAFSVWLGAARVRGLTYFVPSLAIAEVQVLRPDTAVLLDDLAVHPHVIVGHSEIDGYASRGNAYHMTGLKDDGREMAEAIRVAMDLGRIDPSAIDYINAHGSGTKQNDRHETAAFKRSLGQRAYQVPVSSFKSMIGHSLGAIGALELAGCALALDSQVVPPTANLHNPDPELDLDYVPLNRPRTRHGHGAERGQRLRRIPERGGAELAGPARLKPRPPPRDRTVPRCRATR